MPEWENLWEYATKDDDDYYMQLLKDYCDVYDSNESVSIAKADGLVTLNKFLAATVILTLVDAVLYIGASL